MLMNAAMIRLLLAKHVTDKNLMALLERLLGSKLGFRHCTKVPPHDMRIYHVTEWQRIEGTVDGLPAVILVGTCPGV